MDLGAVVQRRGGVIAAQLSSSSYPLQRLERPGNVQQSRLERRCRARRAAPRNHVLFSFFPQQDWFFIKYPNSFKRCFLHWYIFKARIVNNLSFKWNFLHMCMHFSVKLSSCVEFIISCQWEIRGSPQQKNYIYDDKCEDTCCF